MHRPVALLTERQRSNRNTYDISAAAMMPDLYRHRLVRNIRFEKTGTSKTFLLVPFFLDPLPGIGGLSTAEPEFD